MPRKKMQEQIKFRGYLEYVLKDARTGKVVKRGKTRNTVTCWGRGWALARLTPASDAQVLSAIAIGSISSTAPASNQSALGGYLAIRNFGTTGITSATNTACTFYGAVSFNTNETFTGSSQIGEFAIYNSSGTGSGAMFDRLITATYINFATSNTLAVSISITN